MRLTSTMPTGLATARRRSTLRARRQRKEPDMRRQWLSGIWRAALAALLCLSPSLRAADRAPVADAAQRRDATAIRALLRQGADVSAAQGDGMTALHWAAQNGDAPLAKMLLFAG